MMTTWHGIVQVLGAAAVVAGVYLLCGLAWALLAGGVALTGTSVLVEYLSRPRPPAPARNPVEAL